MTLRSLKNPGAVVLPPVRLEQPDAAEQAVDGDCEEEAAHDDFPRPPACIELKGWCRAGCGKIVSRSFLVPGTRITFGCWWAMREGIEAV